MTFRCIGCNRTFSHKTGLSNHWRGCNEWKDYDSVTLQKKRRLEQDLNDAQRLAGPSQDFLDPPEGPGTLFTEVFHLHPSYVYMTIVI
jgi:hypothetical protein